MSEELPIEIVATERPGSFVLRMGRAEQSYVDLEDPTRLAFSYVRRLADLIDACADPGTPLRVVHVGGAGLTLPRYVAATRPRSSQVVLEPVEAVTELVRRELPLPARSGIRVRGVDGRTGLTGLRDGWADALVVDAFVGDRVPPELVTAEALADMARVLADPGVLALNVTDRAPFGWTRGIVAGLGEAGLVVALTSEPPTLRGRGPGNLVLVAGRAPLQLAQLRTAAGRDDPPWRYLDPRQVRDSFGGG